LISCTNLTQYLDGPGSVETRVDGYGRVWAEVHGNLIMQGETDEPLPYLVEVTGRFTAGSMRNKCPHVRADQIDLTNATVSMLSQSEFLARDTILIKRSAFIHLSKRTRRCNRFHFT
jgi:hypothetical protein